MTRTGVQVRLRVQIACTLQKSRESCVGGGHNRLYDVAGEARVGCLEYNRALMRDARADLRER
jgi:hypothetical protein